MDATAHTNPVHLAGPPSGAATTALHLFAPLSGSAYCYGDMARHLGRAPGLRVCGVQAVGLGGRRQPLDRVEAMARAGADAVLDAWSGRSRLVLAGWSFGALVALEAGLNLKRRGVAVSALLLLDNLALAPEVPAPAPELDLATEGLRRVYEASIRAQRAWVGRQDFAPWSGRAVALFSKESAAGATDPALGWGARVTGELELDRVPGDHRSMLEQPHVAACAGRLLRALERRS